MGVENKTVAPLKKHVAMNEIFRCFPNKLEALQGFQLACKVWQAGIASRWKTLAPVKLFQNERLESRTQKIQALGLFLDNIENNPETKDFVRKNFTLISWTIDEDNFLVDVSEEGVIDYNKIFWCFYGENIKKLILRNCKIPHNFTVLPLAFWKSVPSLEQLILLDCEMKLNTKKYFPQSIARIRQAEIINDRVIEGNALIKETLEKLKKSKSAQEKNRFNIILAECQAAVKTYILEPNGSWDDFPKIYFREEFQMETQLRNDAAELSKTCLKLKILEIKKFKGWKGQIKLQWSQVENIFPKLEKLVVRQQDSSELKIPHASTLTQAINEVNVLKYSKFIDRIRCDNLLRLPTNMLSFDCGLDTAHTHVESVLKRQPDRLKKLCLFRAPFVEPYPCLPWTFYLVNLSVLQIRGNVAQNLNFLKLLPFLKKLTWNTSCYDEETHEVRLHYMLGLQTHLLHSDVIVKRTDQLDDNFEHKNMKNFQLETGPLSLLSLKMLGQWLPNLTTFKVPVAGDDQLVYIGKEWPKLKSLKLAHGSMVTARGILDAILIRNVFQRINSFTWRKCPCYDGVWGEEESRTVNLLRRRCGETVVHPWNEPEGKGNEKSPPSGEPCLRELFEKALAGEERSIRMFMYAFLSTPVAK